MKTKGLLAIAIVSVTAFAPMIISSTAVADPQVCMHVLEIGTTDNGYEIKGGNPQLPTTIKRSTNDSNYELLLDFAKQSLNNSNILLCASPNEHDPVSIKK